MADSLLEIPGFGAVDPKHVRAGGIVLGFDLEGRNQLDHPDIDSILMVRENTDNWQNPAEADDEVWSFPKGKLDLDPATGKHEHWLDAVLREIHEETSLEQSELTLLKRDPVIYERQSRHYGKKIIKTRVFKSLLLMTIWILYHEWKNWSKKDSIIIYVQIIL